VGALLASAIALLAAPGALGQPFIQCPAVGVDTSCQYLITVTNAGTTVAQDPAQGPYESSDDSLLAVQNSSSRAIAALPLSAPGMFSFEEDGLCNPGSGAVPPGCVPVPGSPAGTTCGLQSFACSFPPPAGEPPNYTEYFEAGLTPPLAWPNGDRQNGYEGPTSWFTVSPGELNSATVNFSPPIAPGGSSYFSLEAPPGASSIKVGAPSGTGPGGGTTPGLPPAFGPNGAIQGLPSSKVCLSKRHFTIHIRRYARITYLEAIVFINKKQSKVAKSRKGQFTAPIDLRGFPKGTFVVKITVITSTGGIIVGKRTYHTCHRKITPRGHARL
jgi:hypothetical protein